MKTMRLFAAAVLLAALSLCSSAALADCTGQFAAGAICNNTGASTRPPSATINPVIAGGILLGTAPTGGYQGVGTINASGGFYTNGTLVTGLLPVATHTLLCNLTGSSAIPSACTWTAFADVAIGNTNGMLPYRTAGAWTTISTGTAGAVLPLLNGANTWSGVQSFDDGNMLVKGSTSGTLQVRAAATAGTSVLRFPAGSTDFTATGGTSQVVKQTSVGAAFTVARLACADLSNASSGCSAASGITALTGDVTATGPGSVAATVVNLPTGVTMAGSLLATNIVAPGTPASGKTSIYVDSTSKVLCGKNDAGTLACGVIADTGASNNFLTAISAGGVISKAQPAFTNISGTIATGQVSGSYTGITGVGTLAAGAIPTTLLTGTLQAAQFPALTGDVTTSAGALAATIANAAVTYAKMQTVCSYCFVANNSGSTATAAGVTIPGLTLKATPVAGDLVMIADSAAGNAWKQVTVGTLASAGSVSSIAGNTGAFTLGNGIDNATNLIQLTAARRTLPTKQSFLSGSGTYTTPANVLWIEVTLIGGGGGGSGSSGNGGNGGDTCFSASGAACTTPVYDAGGGKGSAGGAIGGLGGTVSGSATCNTSIIGGDGGGSSAIAATGSVGGSSHFGGAGTGGAAAGSSTGAAGKANTGGGGGGGAGVSASYQGGGAGAACIVIINGPASTYTYAVGVGGTAGTGGGADGGTGYIIVKEHYGS